MRKVEVVSVTFRALLWVLFLFKVNLPLYQHRGRRVDPAGAAQERRDGSRAVDEPVDQKRRGRGGQRAPAFLLRTTCGEFG